MSATAADNKKLSLAEEALEYHAASPPGKTSLALTKPAATAHDLS